jgi:uncharacterized protein YfaP (DUF2135 family)/pimeloyl-ACP methyl ester carboxylesterase
MFFGLLLVGLLAGCGSGGGGGTSSPSSVTQVVGSAGGTVSLSDGSAATFAAGVFKANTSVTVSSSPQPSEPLPDGVQTLSSTLAVEIPAGAFSGTLGDAQTITIQLPGTGTSAASTAFSLIGPNPAFAQASVSGSRAILMKLRGLGGRDIISLFPAQAQPIIAGMGRILKLKGAVDNVVAAVKLTFALVDLQNCFTQSMELYQLKEDGSFTTVISRDPTKTALVLVHGTQELNAGSCRRPYETTWKDASGGKFVNRFLEDNDLNSRFQVFSVHYNSFYPIYIKNGPDLAKLLRDKLPQTPVVVLAHSMGGLVARAALAPPPPLDREGVADIRGLVTLATPHEGAPLASREAADVLKALRPAALSAVVLAGLVGRSVDWTLFFTSLLSLTVDGPSVGLKDAAFDSPGFTDYNGNPGNPDLASLRQREANRQLHARQIAFAGKLDTLDFVDAIFRDLNFGLENDSIVPVTSARFTRVSAQGDTFQAVDHLSILDMGANPSVFAAVKSALLGFLPLPPPPPSTFTLAVTKQGTGTGTVTSSQAGINCGSGCPSISFDFDRDASVTLTAMPDSGSTFAGWSGAGCSGTCTVTMSENRSVTATFNVPQGVQGTVRNFVDSTGISNATLTFRSDLGVVLGTTTSETNGGYSLTLPVGSVRGTVSASGFVTTTVDVQVQANTVTTADVALLVQQSASTTGSISGRIDDAVTGSAVSGATVVLRSGINNRTGATVVVPTTTDSTGAYAFTNVTAGTYTATVSKSGYLTNSFAVGVVGGQTRTGQDGTLSPILATGEVRIVLSWGATPSDLDSHLTGPISGSSTRFHVYFGDKGSPTASPFAILDRDDVNSFGPETITIAQRFVGTYRYSVHDYSNRSSTTSSALSNSGAQVKVFVGTSTTPTTFNVPPSRPGTLWTVFEMDGLTGGVITPVNSMTFESLDSVIQSLTLPRSPGEDLELFRGLPAK